MVGVGYAYCKLWNARAACTHLAGRAAVYYTIIGPRVLRQHPSSAAEAAAAAVD